MFALFLDRGVAHRLAFTFVASVCLCGSQSACGDSGESPKKPAAISETAEAEPESLDAATVYETTSAPAAAKIFDVGDDEEAALTAIDAVPAWTAVIDRARYLARRGESGVIYGRVSPKYGDYVWLLDETIGDGALGVRVRGGSLKLEAGARAVLWGAWKVDENRRWYWAAVRAEALPKQSRSAPTAFSAGHPGHEIETVARPPRGSVVAEELPREGGGVYFEVIRGPRRRGDGYVIAGRTRFPERAILKLPGDVEPYGGQDLLSGDESWALKRNVRYALRVRRWRPARKLGELPVWRAISPPKRIQRAGAKQK